MGVGHSRPASLPNIFTRQTTVRTYSLIGIAEPWMRAVHSPVVTLYHMLFFQFGAESCRWRRFEAPAFGSVLPCDTLTCRKVLPLKRCAAMCPIVRSSSPIVATLAFLCDLGVDVLLIGQCAVLFCRFCFSRLTGGPQGRRFGEN